MRSFNCDMYWPLLHMYWENSGFWLGVVNIRGALLNWRRDYIGYMRHGVLYRECITKVSLSDPCPLGLPEILTVAHVRHSLLPWVGPEVKCLLKHQIRTMYSILLESQNDIAVSWGLKTKSTERSCTFWF